jgi:hypothetical protein
LIWCSSLLNLYLLQQLDTHGPNFSCVIRSAADWKWLFSWRYCLVVTSPLAYEAYGSRDRIPPGYRVVVFKKRKIIQSEFWSYHTFYPLDDRLFELKIMPLFFCCQDARRTKKKYFFQILFNLLADKQIHLWRHCLPRSCLYLGFESVKLKMKIFLKRSFSLNRTQYAMENLSLGFARLNKASVFRTLMIQVWFLNVLS